MSKVLVTGGCGFLGAHVCRHYAEEGWEVVAYDNLTKFELSRTRYSVDGARNFVLKELRKVGVEVTLGDITDSARLKSAAGGCNYIVHCAAQPSMTISIEEPTKDFSTNLFGTFCVLEVAWHKDIPVAICSTIHVYGNGINSQLRENESRFVNQDEDINEDAPLLTGTLTPLHASKFSSEVYTRAYIDTYKLNAAILRLTGIYGPWQFGGEDHGWVANFAIKTILGKPITIFGTDKQVRDILYVEDAVRAFDSWYNSGKPGIYNIGGGPKTSISLKECLELLKDITGKVQLIHLGEERLGDLHYFVCDITKAKNTFGWEPTVMPKEGLSNLVSWVKENENLFEEVK